MATIIDALQGVHHRIGAACHAAGRSSDEVTLLAVGKTFPPEPIRELYLAGQRHFGENYAQELVDKVAALTDCPEICWHFIGPLQSNKTRPVAERAHWVHTIDRLKIAERLSAQRPADLPELNVCIQVNVSMENSKSGVAPQDVLLLAHAVSRLPRLRLRGLMCIPEAEHDEAILLARFGEMAQLRDALNAAGLTIDVLSMGMSADLELAIRGGSTMVRVGSALFGARHYP